MFGAGFVIKVYISTINCILHLQLYYIGVQICMLYFCSPEHFVTIC